MVSPVQLSGGRLAGSGRKEAFRKYRSINGAIKGGRFPFYVFRKIFIYRGVLRDNSSLIKTESFIWPHGQYLPGGGCFLTNTHTVYESDKQTDDAGCQDDNTDVPEKHIICY